MSDIKLIPFSIERMAAGEPVFTRYGNEVIDLTFATNAAARGCTRPVIGFVVGDGAMCPYAWGVDGKYIDDIDSAIDLVHRVAMEAQAA